MGRRVIEVVKRVGYSQALPPTTSCSTLPHTMQLSFLGPVNKVNSCAALLLFLMVDIAWYIFILCITRFDYEIKPLRTGSHKDYTSKEVT